MTIQPDKLNNFRDITERKNVEEIEHLLAAIVSSSDDAIVSKTLDGIITSWNTAAERLFGYTAAEAIGQHITLIIPPALHPEEEMIIQKLRNGQRIEHYETIRRRKDGSTFAVSLSISPIIKEGKVIGAAKIARDISERKRLEDELRRSKQQLEVIFQNIADGITVQDKSGALIYANDAGAKLSGFDSVQEMLALNTETLRAHILERFEMKDESGQPVSYSDLPAAKALQGQSYAQILVNYRNKHTGRSFWSVVKASPIVDEQGQVQLAVSIFSDITERMGLEQRKDEFISMASHELKTPITSLKGFTQMLERHLRNQRNEQGLIFLTKMDRQINKLTNLISELLDVSRMQTGKLIFHDEAFDLSALVQEIMENLQLSTQTHQLCLEDTGPVEVVGDRDRIGQALINLITNAIKYSPQADKVMIHVAKDQNDARVSVQDFGIGIAREHQDKIFERFYQVTDLDNRTYPGLGIGLYISREIITRYGGRIWVESSRGKGSTFSMSLPLAQKAQEAGSTDKEPASGPS